MNKVTRIIDLISNIGMKPIAFRFMHEFKKRTGLLKKKYPTTFLLKKFITLNEWKKSKPAFFFNSKETLKEFTLEDKSELKSAFHNINRGQLKFFNGNYLKIGKGYGWVSNPDSKYKYDTSLHWTEIETLDKEAGDIKYVWEKSRFCYLYTLIRYDYHFKEDQSEFVLNEIISWIEQNPVNMGPNYTCSQELSIRMLNWIFALNYYKNSINLTEERFDIIINSIYWQSQHVNKNLKFSLLSVRNNHAITECLLLYVVGLLFPFFEESKKWKEEGKKFLEQEGFYQIYEDGSYLQFSMNYHRVVIQLYTWAFFLSKANKEKFSIALYERVTRSLNFLHNNQDEETGMLPNYGANDGALFFPLNDCHFRDYRPQLNALYFYFTGRTFYGSGKWNEDVFWYTNKNSFEKNPSNRKSRAYETGGYYIMRDENKFSFIRCGNHKDRPSQADNLHLDIWVNGKNILRDCGSYKYNASPEDIRYFMGTASHNTVMVGENDQMQKGGRFMWHYWAQAIEAKIINNTDHQFFKGKIHAFKHIGGNVFHTRTVRQYKKELKWEVEDIIENNKLPLKQIWNISSDFLKEGFEITAKDRKGNIIEPQLVDSFYSPTYGVKEKAKQIIFVTDQNYLKTFIFKKQNI